MQVEIAELESAWRAIRKGGKAPGPDGMDLRTFARDAERHLQSLQRDLRRGRYLPGPYRIVSVPKERGGTRLIQIASLRDRVVQRLLLQRLQPAVEAISLPASFAYRPGIGVNQALRAIASARDSGFAQVFEGDVLRCFDSISFDIVAQLLADLSIDPELADLILQCVFAGGYGASLFADSVGLPQGAVLSPTLCNLVLTQLDRHMQRPHRRLIRYADDLLVLCRSQRACEAAHDEVQEALAEIGLQLNPAKTALSDFTSGFHYLGAQFVRTFIIPKSPPPYGARGHGPAAKGRKRRKLEMIF